jgi:hypothetical protein
MLAWAVVASGGSAASIFDHTLLKTVLPSLAATLPETAETSLKRSFIGNAAYPDRRDAPAGQRFADNLLQLEVEAAGVWSNC